MVVKNQIPSVLETAILEMGRLRGDSTFCPSEVARWLFPQDWRYFMEDIRDEMMRLYQQGKIIVLQKNTPIQVDSNPVGPVRIKVKKTS